ncbi:oxalate decarboxylase OxdD [Ktedonobacter sp. SOSP1-52]|uniref:oxalate decarboxylase family bicupin n=1 Tax=Ktedonobacter sp. SOSP1-52 TaxID=2778366 RepID=UPI001A255901|nr:oxalate decarboxylase family bicupin [Ktedonobacter sp. SOSP1-52]GHO61209.1 oxalate decarboxylase OxdD [Ktedonobacter sp. SOSP1-52]
MDTTRRKILQTLAAAGAVASITSVPAVAHATSTPADEPVPEPIEGNLGATDPGPRNIALDEMNPDTLAPPTTDAGIMPNLKFSFSNAHNRLANGGWARQVTVTELPVSTDVAGVTMRLKEGAVRELHWHVQAEWAYMLNGRAQVTCLDPQGRNFVDNVAVGDLWYFPAGFPHSIQGLQGGCEFLLVFDDGHFSAGSTFMLSDWFAHTPKEVLAKNFGVPESNFANLAPPSSRWIYPGQVPTSSTPVSDPYGTSPQSFTYHLLAQPPTQGKAHGKVRVVDSTKFRVSTTVAAALVEVEPGGLREMHWHPNADEWQYYIEGNGRMTVFAGAGTAATFDYQAGDVGYVAANMGHYVENTGKTTLRFLEIFKTDRYADFSLNQWMAVMPPALVQGDLNLPQQVMDALQKTKPIIV